MLDQDATFAMEGFDADKFANFDPAAMAGFDPTQVEHFDPAAMEGFGRDHMTQMELDSLAAFGLDQVQHLDDGAKQGIGDTVPEFGEFDLDVRKEFVGDDGLRLGGVGSFEDLANQLMGEPTTPEELAAMGWDNSLGNPEDFDFSSGVPDGLVGEALAKAMEAFNNGG
jgi:hypothetical protein